MSGFFLIATIFLQIIRDNSCNSWIKILPVVCPQYSKFCTTVILVCNFLLISGRQ